jgi:hypothetical protein
LTTPTLTTPALTTTTTTMTKLRSRVDKDASLAYSIEKAIMQQQQ